MGQGTPLNMVGSFWKIFKLLKSLDSDWMEVHSSLRA